MDASFVLLIFLLVSALVAAGAALACFIRWAPPLPHHGETPPPNPKFRDSTAVAASPLPPHPPAGAASSRLS